MTNKKRSFKKKMLNNKGPRMEPCVTHSLKLNSIYINYSSAAFQIVSQKEFLKNICLYLYNEKVMVNGIKSFWKINNHIYNIFLSCLFIHFCSIVNKQCWVLWFFLKLVNNGLLLVFFFNSKHSLDFNPLLLK